MFFFILFVLCYVSKNFMVCNNLYPMKFYVCQFDVSLLTIEPNYPNFLLVFNINMLKVCG